MKDVIACFEAELEITQAEIAALSDLVNPDTAPAAYLTFISAMVGARCRNDWSTDKKRHFVKSVAIVYKAQGQVRALRGLLDFFGFSEYELTELYKSELYETFDYSTDEDYGTYRAARIDLHSMYDPFWDGITTSGIGIGSPEVDGVESQITEDLTSLEQESFDLIKSSLPIHVLDRPLGDRSSYSDDLDIVDDVSTFSSCGVWEEEVTCDDGDEAIISQHPSRVCDTYGLQIYLKPYCTDSCQTACQAGPTCQVTACETFCQSHCQGGCEFICQEICEGTCENACMEENQ